MMFRWPAILFTVVLVASCKPSTSSPGSSKSDVTLIVPNEVLETWRYKTTAFGVIGLTDWNRREFVLAQDSRHVWNRHRG